MKDRHIPRTRFGDIVAEFLPPARRKGSRRGADKVVILCGGMPSAPRSGPLLPFLARKGYWVFYPRYRGSWESGGKFLRYSPEEDVLNIIDALPRGFKDIYAGKRYRIKTPEICVIGGSFGGPAAILASRDPRVTRAVAVAPVIDWRREGKSEKAAWMEKFLREAFGEAYRFDHKDWLKLKTGKFYSPAAHAKEIDGRKIFMIHAKNDGVVPYRASEAFAKRTGAQLLLLRSGGHLRMSVIAAPRLWKKVGPFLRG